MLTEEQIERIRAMRVAQGFDPERFDPSGIPAVIAALDGQRRNRMSTRLSSNHLEPVAGKITT